MTCKQFKYFTYLVIKHLNLNVSETGDITLDRTKIDRTQQEFKIVEPKNKEDKKELRILSELLELWRKEPGHKNE